MTPRQMAQEMETKLKQRTERARVFLPNHYPTVSLKCQNCKEIDMTSELLNDIKKPEARQ